MHAAAYRGNTDLLKVGPVTADFSFVWFDVDWHDGLQELVNSGGNLKKRCSFGTPLDVAKYVVSCYVMSCAFLCTIPSHGLIEHGRSRNKTETVNWILEALKGKR